MTAAQAGWEFINPATGEVGSAELLPSTVTPGAAAGYSFIIKNAGPSNISQLYLTSSSSAAPVYLQSDRAGCVWQGVPLYCSFGALNAGDSILVTVAYMTSASGSSFGLTFYLDSTGATGSDIGHNSHGDTLKLPVATALSASKDFAGGFSLADGTVANNGDLGKKNIQSGAVTPPAGAIDIPVTVEDGLADTAFTCPATLPACANTFGQWTRLNVDNGTPLSAGIKVVLTLWGPAVPGQAKLSSVVLIHVPDAGAAYVISDPCTGHGLNAPTTQNPTGECIIPSLVGKNLQIEAWMVSNGGTRFGY